MSGSRNTIVWDKLAGLGFVARLGMLSAMVLLAWLAAAPVAMTLSATSGVIAAAAAAFVCWLGAAAALTIASMFVGPTAAAYALGLSILARTVLPLLLGVALYVGVPALAAAGLAYYLLVFYLLALATETLLALVQIRRSTSGKAV